MSTATVSLTSVPAGDLSRQKSEWSTRSLGGPPPRVMAGTNLIIGRKSKGPRRDGDFEVLVSQRGGGAASEIASWQLAGGWIDFCWPAALTVKNEGREEAAITRFFIPNQKNPEDSVQVVGVMDEYVHEQRHHLCLVFAAQTDQEPADRIKHIIKYERQYLWGNDKTVWQWASWKELQRAHNGGHINFFNPFSEIIKQGERLRQKIAAVLTPKVHSKIIQDTKTYRMHDNSKEDYDILNNALYRPTIFVHVLIYHNYLSNTVHFLTHNSGSCKFGLPGRKAQFGFHIGRDTCLEVAQSAKIPLKKLSEPIFLDYAEVLPKVGRGGVVTEHELHIYMTSKICTREMPAPPLKALYGYMTTIGVATQVNPKGLGFELSPAFDLLWKKYKDPVKELNDLLLSASVDPGKPLSPSRIEHDRLQPESDERYYKGWNTNLFKDPEPDQIGEELGEEIEKRREFLKSYMFSSRRAEHDDKYEGDEFE